MQDNSINNQKGFIEIAIIAIVAVVLVAGGYFAYQYYMNNQTDESGLTAQEKQELKAACKVEIDDELLCSVFSQWGQDSDEPVTVTTTMSGENGSSTAVTKMDGKNYHSTTEMDGMTHESMVVGDMMYTKHEGVWYKQKIASDTEASSETPDMSEPDQVTNEIISEEEVDDVEYKRLGTEKCGNVTCVKYQVTTKDKPDELSYFWIDPSKARIMHMQSKSGSDTFDLVYVYGPVTITPPADAKDISEMMMGM